MEAAEEGGGGEVPDEEGVGWEEVSPSEFDGQLVAQNLVARGSFGTGLFMTMDSTSQTACCSL